MDKARFEESLRQFDAANAQDPQQDEVAGELHPREVLFSKCVERWVRQLNPEPSESLQLAARGHTLERWAIPRSHYPMTRVGYHEWRGVVAHHHAERATEILRDAGYDKSMIERVAALTLRTLWPDDDDARTLEDADCLAFLELKLHRYVDEWGDKKTLRILKRTFAKMTPEGQTLAATVDLSPQEAELLHRATQ